MNTGLNIDLWYILGTDRFALGGWARIHIGGNVVEGQTIEFANRPVTDSLWTIVVQQRIQLAQFFTSSTKTNGNKFLGTKPIDTRNNPFYSVCMTASNFLDFFLITSFCVKGRFFLRTMVRARTASHIAYHNWNELAFMYVKRTKHTWTMLACSSGLTSPSVDKFRIPKRDIHISSYFWRDIHPILWTLNHNHKNKTMKLIFIAVRM